MNMQRSKTVLSVCRPALVNQPDTLKIQLNMQLLQKTLSILAISTEGRRERKLS